jgi:hypothetical protein
MAVSFSRREYIFQYFNRKFLKEGYLKRSNAWLSQEREFVICAEIPNQIATPLEKAPAARDDRLVFCRATLRTS